MTSVSPSTGKPAHQARICLPLLVTQCQEDDPLIPTALDGVLSCLMGFGFSSGVVAVGPDTYAISKECAPVLGSGREANRIVLA